MVGLESLLTDHKKLRVLMGLELLALSSISGVLQVITVAEGVITEVGAWTFSVTVWLAVVVQPLVASVSVRAITPGLVTLMLFAA
jgi:hypothetical protein